MLRNKTCLPHLELWNTSLPSLILGILNQLHTNINNAHYIVSNISALRSVAENMTIFEYSFQCLKHVHTSFTNYSIRGVSSLKK